mmetsp:Transcript_34570/g.80106  ORF Transcript_34570/g.80106 Transcript_34570/m.80106 type:complete len:107 (-) Transcript_34570:1628-1948(-)
MRAHTTLLALAAVLDATTAVELRWSVLADSTMGCETGVAVGRDDAIFVQDMDRVYRVAPDDGTVVWSSDDIHNEYGSMTPSVVSPFGFEVKIVRTCLPVEATESNS